MKSFGKALLGLFAAAAAALIVISLYIASVLMTPERSKIILELTEHRQTHRASQEDVTAIVEKYVSSGADATQVLDELRSEGFVIRGDISKSFTATRSLSNPKIPSPVFDQLQISVGVERSIITRVFAQITFQSL